MHATKLLVPRGGREPGCDVMNEIFVYCTDVDLELPVGDDRLYHQLVNFVVDKWLLAGSRCDKVRVKYPRPAWDTDGLGSITTHDSKFMLHFKCCKESLHLEAYDSEINIVQFTFRNNHAKMTSTLVLTRGGITIFEGNVLQMFTQANLMTATSQIMRLHVKCEPSSSDVRDPKFHDQSSSCGSLAESCDSSLSRRRHLSSEASASPGSAKLNSPGR